VEQEEDAAADDTLKAGDPYFLGGPGRVWKLGKMILEEGVLAEDFKGGKYSQRAVSRMIVANTAETLWRSPYGVWHTISVQLEASKKVSSPANSLLTYPYF
jgi:hypothetical protein